MENWPICVLTVLNRGERGAPLDSSAEEMAGRLLMNYADGTKHGEAAAKSINASTKLTEKKSNRNQAEKNQSRNTNVLQLSSDSE